MIKNFYILFLFLCSFGLSAQFKQATIDTVYSYRWGTGQNNGQDEAFFPANVFGKPDSATSAQFQSSDPNEICSIGLGGEIIVGFKDFEIVDGPGPDFTIFENAFINPVNKKIFAEPALVSVSSDGINFYDFPFDSLTLVGCAGISPTIGMEDCFNPVKSGGDKFDLAILGIQSAKFIRIKDITNMLLGNQSHPYYDPILSGFDLDAVAGLNLMPIVAADINEALLDDIRLLVSDGSLLVETEFPKCSIKLFNRAGKMIGCQTNPSAMFSNLPKGVYFLLIISESRQPFRRRILL